MSVPRRAFVDGARAILPLALPGIPFGLVYGVAVTQTPEVNAWAGWAASLIVVAGAAQLAALSLLGQGTGIIGVALTITVINARHAMYSAALSARFRRLPRRFRVVAPYLLLDQSFAVADALDDHVDGDVEPEYRMGHYAGSGGVLLTMWLSATTVGVLAGSAIPESWSLDYAVPLMFLGLLVLGVRNLPGLLAALVGGTVAVIGADAPNGSGLLAGALLGVVVAGAADAALERRRGQEPS